MTKHNSHLSHIKSYIKLQKPFRSREFNVTRCNRMAIAVEVAFYDGPGTHRRLSTSEEVSKPLGNKYFRSGEALGIEYNSKEANPRSSSCCKRPALPI